MLDLRAAGALAILALGLAGCARLGVPTPAFPGSGNEGMAELLESRGWIEGGADAPRGTLRAFLPDGTLVMTSCTETYRLAPWRWVEGATLVWEEDGRNLRAEVAMVQRNQLVLVIDLGDGETLTRTYRAAAAPEVCPDLPR
jgi:hypothetical protein